MNTKCTARLQRNNKRMRIAIKKLFVQISSMVGSRSCLSSCNLLAPIRVHQRRSKVPIMNTKCTRRLQRDNWKIEITVEILFVFDSQWSDLDLVFLLQSPSPLLVHYHTRKVPITNTNCTGRLQRDTCNVEITTESLDNIPSQWSSQKKAIPLQSPNLESWNLSSKS